MNNIEIKNLPGLKPGMTDKQINELKTGKKIEPVFEKVIKKRLPSAKVEEELINLVKLNLIKDEVDDRDYKLSAVPFGLQSKVDYTNEMSRVKNQGSLGCHDDKTEVLTNQGWKLFKDLDKSEEVATVNPHTHKLEYQKPINYFEYDYSGKMMNLIHRDENIFSVTPNHKMYVRQWNQRKRKLYDEYNFIEMRNLGWYSGLLNEINSESLLEENERYKKVKYKLPDVEIGLRNNAKKVSIREGKKIELYKLIEFIGLYFAEGCCYYDGKGSYRVEIAASDKNERKPEVVRIVESLGFNFTNYSDRLTIRNKSLFNFLKDFGDVYTKEIPRWIFNLDKKYIELFLNGYVLGDGRYEDNGGIFCWSVNKKLLDGIQELFLKIGKWSTIRISKEEQVNIIENREIYSKESYYLYVWYKKQFSIDRKKYIKEIDYNGKVYCVEVPNHIIITRRNNNMLISGNSCVGFATAAMKEWQEQQEHMREVAAGKPDHRDEDHYDLSEQWIYYKCKTIDPWPNQEGTSIRCAMQVLHKIGVPCEEAYPYNDQYKGKPESWAKLIAKWGLIDSYYRCGDLNALKSSLATNGPTVIGIACFREIFMVGSNGYIPYPNNPNEIYGGHAICAVGYDDSTKCIKFKNSWGTGWGNRGYGLLPYNYIRDFMWDAWVAKDLAVTKKILNERAMDELV